MTFVSFSLCLGKSQLPLCSLRFTKETPVVPSVQVHQQDQHFTVLQLHSTLFEQDVKIVAAQLRSTSTLIS